MPVSYNNNFLTAQHFVRTVNNLRRPLYLCNDLNDIVAEGRVGRGDFAGTLKSKNF